MRHGKRVKKLGRTKEHRKAMLCNMAASLLAHIQIRTTLTKAKAAKQVVDRLITLAKRGDLHARRQAYDVIRQRTLVKKLFNEIGPKFSQRNGGYTRVLKLGTRRGDGAQLAVLELLMEKPVKISQKEKKEKGEKKVAKVSESKRKETKKEPKETKAKSKKKPEKKEK